jgi:hypothetical protein
MSMSEHWRALPADEQVGIVVFVALAGLVCTLIGAVARQVTRERARKAETYGEENGW